MILVAANALRVRDAHMEEARRNEIQIKAEKIASTYFRDGIVDPLEIAEDYNIDVVANRYGDSFKGTIIYSNGVFNICLNTDRIKSVNHSDGRLTLAHELGHFFIDEHRNDLEKGYKYSFGGDFCSPNNNSIEQEADLFAASLLLPDSKLREYYHSKTIGWDAILEARSDFETPITCTAKHCVSLNIAPSMLIQRSDNGYITKLAIGSKLAPVFGQNPFVKFNPQRTIREKTSRQHSTGMQIVSGYSFLSNWVTHLPTEMRSSLIFEETLHPEKQNWTLTLISTT